MGSNFLIEASNVFLERGDAVLGEFWDVVLQDDSIVVSLLDAFMHRGQSVEDTQRGASLSGSIGHEDARRGGGCGQQTDVVFEAAVVVGKAVAHEEESHGRRRGGWGDGMFVRKAAGQEPHEDTHPATPQKRHRPNARHRE
jgi:hypothetical protein